MKTIVELACEAGFMSDDEGVYLDNRDGVCQKQIERLIALVRADEREACAKVCEEMPTYVSRYNALIQASAKDCATAIRARGNT